MKIQNAYPIIKGISQPVRQEDAELREASKGMEATFISMLVSAMEKTIPDTEFTGSGNNLAKMLFSSVMGKALAEQGGLGFADKIYGLLAKQDEAFPGELNHPFSTEVWQYLKTTGVKDD